MDISRPTSSNESFKLTHDTVIDFLLLRLDPPIPLGHLLVDAAAHPGFKDILRLTWYITFSQVVPDDKFTRPRRKHDRVGTPVDRLDTEDSCI